MTDTLSKAHLDDLRRSGLTDETIRCAHLVPAPAEQIMNRTGIASTGYVIPYLHTADVHGKPAFWRIRLDRPIYESSTRQRKYTQPAAEPRLYFPPSLLVQKGARYTVRRDLPSPLYVTEGEKKALAGAQAGLAVVALGGVWNWLRRGRDAAGEKTDQSAPIADLSLIEWKDRDVRLVFDSDAGYNENVLRAERKLAEHLRLRGARVSVIRLPGSKDEKVGLDDYLVAHGVKRLQRIMPRPGRDSVPNEQFDMLAALLRQPEDPMRWFWEGWIPEERVTVMWGPGGAGKTYLNLALALGAATGIEMFPGAPKKARSVLWVTHRETHKETEKRRAWKLLRGQGVTREAQLPDPLPFVRYDPDGPLTNPLVWDRLLTRVAEVRPEVIVMDSASSLSAGVDEVSNPEVNQFMRERILPLARDYRATVVLLHHARKTTAQQKQSSARGAGAWIDAADHEIQLRKLGKTSFTIEVGKVREGTPPEPLVITLEDTEDKRGLTLELADGEVVETAADKARVAVPRLFKGLTSIRQADLIEQVAKETGVSRTNAKAAVLAMRGKRANPRLKQVGAERRSPVLALVERRPALELEPVKRSGQPYRY